MLRLWYGFCNNLAMIKKGIILTLIIGIIASGRVSAYGFNPDIGCHDLEIVYARGSGAKQDTSAEYDMVSDTAGKIASVYSMSVAVSDLHYDAVGVSTIGHLIGAFISAGKSYAFGRSVRGGVGNMVEYYRARRVKCPDEKWILVGYSQGAMVMSQALESFDDGTLAFIMLLGDPNAYLPEGAGIFPEACRGGKLSQWRTYAPNCFTHRGVFGPREPYEQERFAGRYSLWCNRNDYICGGSFSPLINSGHTSYADLGEIEWGMMYLMKKYFGPYSTGARSSMRTMTAARDGLLGFRGAGDSDFDTLIEAVDAKEEPPRRIDAPINVEATLNGEEIKVEWDTVSKYMLLRLNGYDLGYIDGDLGEVTITDVETNVKNRLEIFAMNEAGDLSAATEKVFDSVEYESITDSIDTVQTVDGGADSASDARFDGGGNKLRPENVRAASTSLGIAEDIGSASSTSDTNETEDFLGASLLDDGFKPRTTRSIIPEVDSVSGKGLSFAQRSNVVGVLLGVFGAFGLLLLFAIKKRRE